ncbi:MAG: prenyltransferase/squalene oxidase repeat-containing protein [Brevefilum fermentans]|uniref:Squalene cyclase C-terminal domain-containing protein n=1 Tax=Candidatus Brevifilum fermentans TaxID=1986204 RepID=A0A1Y6K637_9CHLR|nr:prenyltransferase/squalene oxidase repeat-containing protein [Brevefilum fermentans]SMX54307.1 exported protein of unknown function [Brevefilum fermentans]
METPLRKAQFFIVFLTLLSLAFAPLLHNTRAQSVSSEVDVHTAILQAVEYLKTQQNDDGGIRWIDESSSVAVSVRVVLALAASRLPQEVLTSSQGLTPVDYLANQGYDWIFQSENGESELNLARAGQLLTAVAAANQDPYAFGSERINLPYLINDQYDPNSGVFGKATPNNVTDQVWAILGLASAYASVPQDSVTWLSQAQQADGSWDDGFGSTLDMTPLAVMALLSSDYLHENDPEILLALDFIGENQQSNGGWQTEWDSTTSANVTGMILQSLYAAGHQLTDPLWTKEDGSPLDALLHIQQENGAFGADYINAYGTADGILGLSDQPLYDLGHVRRVGRAFAFVFDAQDDDGGWGSTGQTLDVIIAAQAAGWDPQTIAINDRSPLTFLANNLEAYIASGPDAIGKSIIGLVAPGQDPTNFNGLNLVQALIESYNPDTAAFGDPENTWHQALSLLGLKAANVEIPEGALQTLLDLQREDGGWEYATGFGTWADSTALALQALLASGLSSGDDAIQNGFNYLRGQQLESGGWGDASTTSFVIMALNASDLHPDEWRTQSNGTPIPDLFTYQKPSGAFMFSEDFVDDNLMATTAALLALIGGHYYIQHTFEVPTNSVGLVIQDEQDTITTACVNIEGKSISGLALLKNSGIPYEDQDGFINSIMNRSNPQDGTLYWSYWHWDGREWIFHTSGAGDIDVLPGNLEAWYLVSWERFPSPPPEYTPHIQVICGENQLKNYAAQPYLHYYDLNKTAANVNQAQKFSVKPYSQDIESTTTDPQSETKPLSTTPLIIIGVLGVLVIALVVWLLFRKK